MVRAGCASPTHAPDPRSSAPAASPSQDHHAASRAHHSPLTTHHDAFLIASAKLLETALTPSVSAPSVFLIATFCPIFCHLYRLESHAFPSRPSPSNSSLPAATSHAVAYHQSPCPTDTWRLSGSHANIAVRLLLLDTPSVTVCTGFDQGCKDRARKPFLAVTQ
jgi:hypothetical protein